MSVYCLFAVEKREMCTTNNVIMFGRLKDGPEHTNYLFHVQ